MRTAFVATALGLMIAACSSSSTNSAGGGGASGSGGSTTTGGTGGASGTSGGTTATGGAAGTTGGTTATGGAAGATGGTTATGGSAGATGGGAGDAGTDAGPGASVPCPTLDCSLASAQCCYDPTGPTTACQQPGASCPKPAYQIHCNAMSDCKGSQVCCLTLSVATGTTTVACKDASTCVSNCSDAGFCVFTATQLCDPSLSPTECVYPAPSTCKAYTGSALPPGYFSCQK